jgi:hypothetical protein
MAHEISPRDRRMAWRYAEQLRKSVRDGVEIGAGLAMPVSRLLTRLVPECPTEIAQQIEADQFKPLNNG